MEQKELSPKFKRQRKFLMVLPLLIIPFLIMGFWALGLGKGKAAEQTTNTGLNTTMPKAVLKDERGFTKMSFYDEVQMDSLKMKERQKNDPFFFKKSFTKDSIPSLSNLSKYTDPNEQKVYQKLAELNSVIHQQQPPEASPVATQPVNNNTDVNRLEQLMRNMKEQNEDDTEMQRLSNMMDKIIAIQHPESMKDTIKTKTTKAIDVVPVEPAIKKNNNGFYAANEDASKEENNNVIQAITPETQTLVSGSTIKLLLLQDIMVKGYIIPKNSFVYGTASLNNERLKITIVSIHAGNNIVPVSLEVYDMDGLAGIYVPGSIGRDVAKQSADESMNGIGLATLDPSIGAQAASAGIQAAKSLIGKKVKLVKVTVRAGYQLLLKQTN